MIENKIAEMLGQLADKLGVASAKIWEWSLLQVKVEIVTDIIYAVLAVVLSILIYRVAKKYNEFLARETEKKKENNPYYVDSEFDIVVVAILVGVAIVFLLDLYAISGLLDLPKLLINPEYAAFQNIVEQLGSLK